MPFLTAIVMNELRHARGYFRCSVYLPVMLPPASPPLLLPGSTTRTNGLFNDVLRALHLPVQWLQSGHPRPPWR